MKDGIIHYSELGQWSPTELVKKELKSLNDNHTCETPDCDEMVYITKRALRDAIDKNYGYEITMANMHKILANLANEKKVDVIKVGNKNYYTYME